MLFNTNRFVGLEDLFDLIQKSSNAADAGYPPVNIINLKNDSYRIEAAVAGWKRDELSVVKENNTLQVTGKKIEHIDDVEYVHKGLARRNFQRSFTLGMYVEVSDVTLKDGILTIDLIRKLPEEKKPKTFEIR